MTRELVACPQCARNNSVLRQKCIYCGANLPVTREISAQTVATRASQTRDRDAQQQLDPLSQLSTKLQEELTGFNLVLLPDSLAKIEITTSTIRGITCFTDTEIEQLARLNIAMPLARFQTMLEAKAIQEQLGKSNIDALIISDEELQVATPNPRIKQLQIMDGQTLTIRGENQLKAIQTLATNEILLITEGKIRYRQQHATEQNKGFAKMEREITAATEYVDEQAVLDVYTSALSTSFRVRADAFDYSGLGSKMKLTTTENFRMLVTTLMGLARSAVYDANFKQCSKLLEVVWPTTARSESGGIRRAQMLATGKIATRSVIHFDNEMQFNRYSRLLYHLTKMG